MVAMAWRELAAADNDISTSMFGVSASSDDSGARGVTIFHACLFRR